MSNLELTSRQRAFCQKYLVDLNGAAAARRTGYAAGSADVTACRLLGNAKVASLIAELQDEVAERYRLSVDGVVAMPAELRDEATAARQMGPAIRAQELIGRTIGAFVDRQQIGQETLGREQLIEQISEGDPTRRRLAKQLFNVPRSFEEGANEHTRNLAKSTG